MGKNKANNRAKQGQTPESSQSEPSVATLGDHLRWMRDQFMESTNAEIPGLRLRMMLDLLVTSIKKGCPAACYQDEAKTSAVFVKMVSDKTQPDGARHLTVDYSLSTADKLDHRIFEVLQGALKIGMGEFEVGLLDQDALFQELEANKIQEQPPNRGVLTRSLLKIELRSVEDDMSKASKPHKTCAACGSKEDVKLSCGSCKAVQYCSVECQKKHWKEGHREVCKSSAAAREKALHPETQSVVFNVKTPNDAAFPMAGMKVSNTSLVSGKTRMLRAESSTHKNVHGDSMFMVKVQVPGSGGPSPIMMYDQCRSFQRLIFAWEPCYQAISQITMANAILGAFLLRSKLGKRNAHGASDRALRAAQSFQRYILASEHFCQAISVITKVNAVPNGMKNILGAKQEADE
eukprot:gene28049-31151_t